VFFGKEFIFMPAKALMNDLKNEDPLDLKASTKNKTFIPA